MSCVVVICIHNNILTIYLYIYIVIITVTVRRQFFIRFLTVFIVFFPSFYYTPYTRKSYCSNNNNNRMILLRIICGAYLSDGWVYRRRGRWAHNNNNMSSGIHNNRIRLVPRGVGAEARKPPAVDVGEGGAVAEGGALCFDWPCAAAVPPLPHDIIAAAAADAVSYVHHNNNIVRETDRELGPHARINHRPSSAGSHGTVNHSRGLLVLIYYPRVRYNIIYYVILFCNVLNIYRTIYSRFRVKRSFRLNE